MAKSFMNINGTNFSYIIYEAVSGNRIVIIKYNDENPMNFELKKEVSIEYLVYKSEEAKEVFLFKSGKVTKEKWAMVDALFDLKED